MDHRWLCGLAAAAMVAALPAIVSAQTGPRASPGLQQPQLRDDEQILPSQIVQPPPSKPKKTAAKPAPKRAPASDNTDDNPVVVAKPVAARPAVAANPPSDDNPGASARPAASPKTAEPARTVACSNGAFAKNSGHLRLAQAYGVHNVDFTEVAGDDGSTLMASVLFPNDPKKRLEVLWDDDTERTGIRMIVIGSQSTWTAQKGVHLGLPLAAMEKLNGKPFKLMGFDKGMAAVTDWNGGALGLLTDGCRMTVQFKPDPKTPPAALDAAGSEREFVSSDAAIRAVKPTVGEIIVGY
jgi:hypothetical protein